jgi:hypothetical protein
MDIDKAKLKGLLWAEAASYRADCADWKRNTDALDEFLGEKTLPEVALELLAENELARMRIKELDLLFGRYLLAMRSALIEEEHGKGPAAAMEWIYNSLAGPGELPPEGETDSQAYFDREIVAVDNGMQEVMAFHEGRRAAMGKGEQP